MIHHTLMVSADVLRPQVTGVRTPDGRHQIELTDGVYLSATHDELVDLMDRLADVAVVVGDNERGAA